jgi:cytochrome c oxidase subunit II
MTKTKAGKSRRVLIASSHPLFAQGLRRLLQERQEKDLEVLGVVASLEESVDAIKNLQPDLVIVDYDDEVVNREEFLTHFIEGVGRLRVVLLSLKEGGDQAVVYDRRNIAASMIDDWLKEWTEIPEETIKEDETNLTSEGRRDHMKHWIGVILFIVVIGVLSLLVLRNDNLLTQAASLQAQPVDQAFSYLWILIAVLFALITGFVLYSAIFFRRKPGDTSDGPHIEGNNALEVTWTVLPLLTVFGFAIFGSANLAEVLRPDPEAYEVRVIGQQWAWRFEYPEEGVVSEELVLPINQQILLRMESADVLHSFWVPEFRVKQDLLPGRETQLRITPSRIGEFTVRCAEICGSQHAYMLAPVRVVSQGEFENWLFEKLDLPEDPAARGELWFTQYGCQACHSLDGTAGVGPSWLGVYDHEVRLTDGSTVIADDDYLYESIVQPNAKIVEGYQANIMPQNYDDVMTEVQIRDIIEFMKTLR